MLRRLSAPTSLPSLVTGTFLMRLPASTPQATSSGVSSSTDTTRLVASSMTLRSARFARRASMLSGSETDKLMPAVPMDMFTSVRAR